MNDKIKVLFLDIDNTLLDFDAAAAGQWSSAFRKRDWNINQKCLLLYRGK